VCHSLRIAISTSDGSVVSLCEAIVDKGG
jgi:hypothetical protein